MKRTLLQILIALLLPAAVFAQGSKWHNFTSAEGHYSVNFPGVPTESVQMDTSSGTILKIMMASYAVGDNEVYMTSFIDMKDVYDKEKSMKQLLEASRDGALGSMNVTKSETVATNLTGDPYIEFTFSNSEFTGKDRIYFINKCQYSVITIFSLANGLSVNTDKFIRSFKHTL